MSLLDKWNKNKFSIYKSEEKTVLKLIEEIGKWIETLIKGLDGKTDLYGDHKGSWQGLTRPTLSEEGMRSTVETLVTEVKSINTKTINVNAYGVVGDNLTDNYKIIQQLADDLHAKGGGCLYFPSGRYNISKSIKLYDDVTIQMESGNKSFLQPMKGGKYENNFMVLINSTNGFTSDLPISAQTSDNKEYQIYFNNREDISTNHNIYYEGIKGIFLCQANCKFNRLSAVGFKHALVVNEDNYLDNIVIENGTFISVHDYQIVKLGNGECLTIRNCKVYESVQGNGIDWKLAKVKNTLNLRFENIINGGVDIEDCSVSVSNLHIEKGQWNFLNCRGIITNSMIYHPRNENYCPLNLRGKWKNTFTLSEVEFILTPFEHPYGEIITGFDLYTEMGILTLNNVTRKLFIDYNNYSTTGIKIYSTDTNLMKLFNNNSSQLSIEGKLIYGTVETPLRYFNDRYSGNDIISVSQDNTSTFQWHNIETNLYYNCQLFYGDYENLNGVNMLNDVMIHASTKPIEISIYNQYLSRNAIMRLYRGTERGQYSAYVDIPLVENVKLLDTGTQVNGFKWNYTNVTLENIKTKLKPFKYIMKENNEVVFRKEL